MRFRFILLVHFHLFCYEIAYAAPKTVIGVFSEQGSYSVCIDLEYTVVVENGVVYDAHKKKVFKNGWGFALLLGN